MTGRQGRRKLGNAWKVWKMKTREHLETREETKVLNVWTQVKKKKSWEYLEGREDEN